MAKQLSVSKKSPLKYDAYGRPLPQGKSGNPFLRFLLGFLLPYVLINGLVFFLAVARPSIECGEPDTQDYLNARVHITVSSLLPVRELSASMEGDTVVLEQDGNGYTASVQSNGTLSFNVTAWNGMSANAHVQINLLDDAAPAIDEESIVFEPGFLQFNVEDSQSGIDYDGIYGIDGDGDEVQPSEIDRESGMIRFSLKNDTIQIFLRDMAGNESTANFSLN